MKNTFLATSNHIVSEYIIVILFMFLFGCMIGYLSETLYRRFVSAKKWVNPGFMHGPWLPLYGSGLVVMFGICALIINLFPSSMPLYNPLGNLFSNKVASGPTVYDLIPIAIIWVCLVLLEFIAGVIFVRGFKVRLWDYTNMKGNILGVICPQFSVIWLIVDLVFYYGLNPYVYIMFRKMFDLLFEGGSSGQVVNVFLIFDLGIIYGIFLIDLVISLGVFSKLVKMAKESEGLKHYETYRAKQKAKLLENKAKLASYIPESVKEKYDNAKAAVAKESSKFSKFIAKLMYIDPNKTSTADNYDSSGRPKKES